MTVAVKLPPIRGLLTAKQVYVDGLADIQYLGVNARYVPFCYQRDENGLLFRNVEITVLCPVGGMVETAGLIGRFMDEHLRMRTS